jgi:hypothetical protein
MKRNYIFIVASGFLVPIGIIIAGNADTSDVYWLAVALSVTGVLGVILGLYRHKREYKGGSTDGTSQK